MSVKELCIQNYVLLLEKISIGETAVVLEGDIRNRETNLGNFAADGLLQWVSMAILCCCNGNNVVQKVR